MDYSDARDSGYIIFGLIVGIAYDKITLVVPAFIVMHAMIQSSGIFGPGNMEGTISAESYPTSIRGTCYGLSAALGKTGAAVGTQCFTPIQSAFSSNQSSWTQGSPY
jgi:hypothetical protein